MAYLLFAPIALIAAMNILVLIGSVLPGMHPTINYNLVSKRRGLFLSVIHLTLCYLAAQYVITLL